MYRVLYLTFEEYSEVYFEVYSYSYKDKGLEQRHCVVTMIQSYDQYMISLVRIPAPDTIYYQSSWKLENYLKLRNGSCQYFLSLF